MNLHNAHFLKIGGSVWIAAVIMRMIYLSGEDITLTDFFKYSFIFLLAGILPTMISSLTVAKGMEKLKVTYNSNLKAYGIGFLSVLSVSWLLVLCLSFFAILYSSMFRDKYQFDFGNEIYSLWYVLGVGTILSSWVLVPLTVWQARYLKQWRP